MNASLLIATLLLSQVAAPSDNGIESKSLPELSAKDHEFAKSTLQQMWSNLEKIQTGDVLIHELSVNSFDTQIFQSRLIFDHAEDALRFEILASPLDQPGKYIQSSAGDFVSANNDHSIYRISRDQPRPSMKTQPFDLRRAGISLLQHPHLDLTWFQDFYSLDHPNPKAGKLSEVFLSELRVIDLVWIGESNGEQFRTLIRIDAGRGHTPIYCAHWRTNPEGEFELYSANSTQWIMRQNFWLPVQAEYENFRHQTKHQVTLVWNTINNSIPSETFTLKGLDLSEGIPVIDRNEQREPIVIGTINVDGDFIAK